MTFFRRDLSHINSQVSEATRLRAGQQKKQGSIQQGQEIYILYDNYTDSPPLRASFTGGAKELSSAPHFHLVPMLRMVELHLHSRHVFIAWCLIKATNNFILPLPENR
jgi:hypothetical protein